MHNTSHQPPTYRPYSWRTIDELPQFQSLTQEERFSLQVVSQVFPFRLNNYVAEELINWDRIPDDRIYQLTVPQRGMLHPRDFHRIADLLRADAPQEQIRAAVGEIHGNLNPHPAGQVDLNVPWLNGEPLEGLQHKYRETVLFFPAAGQTCHAYCTFCFRWPQFLTDSEVRFAARDSSGLLRYLRAHPEVTDILVTGGDPMVMSVGMLEQYLTPVTTARDLSVRTIRLGTKSLGYWPYRYVTDRDADDLLRYLEHLVVSGFHVAVMAHFNHPRELETPVVREAVRRIRSTGAEIRSQSPVVRHINDVAAAWRDMWNTQVNLGIIPYYMFVERNTGASRYFQVPLVRAWEIYRAAMQGVSGLGRTVRGPIMSAAPGKVEIQGVMRHRGEDVFVLRMVQGRNPEWVERPFLAKFDGDAAWLTDLEPASREEEFFFAAEMRARRRAAGEQLPYGASSRRGQTSP